jgi:hypothetical protein
MPYTVTSAACTVYLATGAQTLLYRGDELPAADLLREGEAKRLQDGGFVTSEPVEKTRTTAEKKAVAAAEKKAAAHKAAADRSDT